MPVRVIKCLAFQYFILTSSIVSTDEETGLLMSIDFIELIPFIIEALKEQQAQIESLENQLNKR